MTQCLPVPVNPAGYMRIQTTSRNQTFIVILSYQVIYGLYGISRKILKIRTYRAVASEKIY